MYELSVKATFSAAHRVRGHLGGCANLHGHNWDVEVILRGAELEETGFLVDFKDVKAAVREIMEKLDHADLNALESFRVVNPTSENLAAFIFRETAGRLNCARYRVYGVRVAESAGTCVLYTEG
ncbi:MAG: 6-carboxytetrahydropterin synthase QueD [Kiritimatiellia bacterium]